MTSRARPVLVAGIPRSGTTWTGHVLAHARGSVLLHEPDNEKEHLSALRAKRGLGRFPALRPGDPAAAYEALWRRAFSAVPDPAGGPKAWAARLWQGTSPEQREEAVRGRPGLRLRLALELAGSSGPPAGDDHGDDVVVKSVHAPLALDWLAHRFPTVRVVIVLRHPANVLSSWRELALPDQDRALDQHPAVREGFVRAWGLPLPTGDALSRASWHVCLLTAALLDAAGRHPQWLVVDHEDLCRRPTERFGALADELGMTWTESAEQYLQASDAAGEGFALRRRAGEQPGRWRSRLSAEEVDVLAGTIQQFPLLDRWSDDLGRRTTGPGHG